MFPNLKNRRFIDLSSNESFQVKDQFENIAILSNNQRVDVKRLLDSNFYDEQIDPKDFLSQQSLISLAEKIKSIPTEALNTMKDDDGPAIMEYDPEEEKRMLMEKARQMSNPNNAAQSQIEKFKDLMDEEDIPVVQPHQSPQHQPVHPQPVQLQEYPVRNSTMENNNPHTSPEDPMIIMFKNTKKNTDLKITFDIENKIPRPDFIEMMEDSYEVSIIDYLSEEFTKQILENPSIIKDKIKEEINKIVYKSKKEVRVIPTVSEEHRMVLPEGAPKKKRAPRKKEETK
jgi:hypothetical protein